MSIRARSKRTASSLKKSAGMLSRRVRITLERVTSRVGATCSWADPIPGGANRAAVSTMLARTFRQLPMLAPFTWVMTLAEHLPVQHNSDQSLHPSQFTASPLPPHASPLASGFSNLSQSDDRPRAQQKAPPRRGLGWSSFGIIRTAGERRGSGAVQLTS